MTAYMSPALGAFLAMDTNKSHALTPLLLGPAQTFRRGLLEGEIIPPRSVPPVAGGVDPLPTKPGTTYFPPAPGRRPPQFGDRFREMFQPEIMLPVAAGMFAGGTPAESMALATAALGSGIKESRKRTQTHDYIARTDPELAQMIDAGLDPADAWGVLIAERKAGFNKQTDQYGLPTSGAISQKVRALMLQGIPEETALGLASGRYTVSVNPMTGDRVIVDVATGQLVPLQQPGMSGQSAGTEQPPLQAQQGGQTLYDQAEAATGFGSAIAGGLSNTLGQVPGAVGDMATFPRQIQAQQDFDLFKRNLILSLSVNPRFPVAEQQRIENLVPRGAFTAPETLKTSLRALDAELARIEAETAQAMNDPNAPVETRQADAATNRAVKAARQRLGVPQGASGGWGGTQGTRRTSGGVKWNVE